MQNRSFQTDCEKKFQGTVQFCITCQLQNELYLIVIFHFSLVKGGMNDLHLFKLHKDCLTVIGYGAMVLAKRLHFFIFQLPQAEQRQLRPCQLRKS
jgi:hypothetical protein